MSVLLPPRPDQLGDRPCAVTAGAGGGGGRPGPPVVGGADRELVEEAGRPCLAGRTHRQRDHPERRGPGATGVSAAVRARLPEPPAGTLARTGPGSAEGPEV